MAEKSYFDIYKQRINRYGNTQQERIQKQREKVFDIKVENSVYRVEFEYQGSIQVGTLERGSQSNSETIQYLFTKVDLIIPNGTILDIVDLHGVSTKWMIYYLEKIQASGYNKYIVLKMTHTIVWKDQDGVERSSFGYVYGQEDNMLKDELRSRSRTQVLYTENIKLNFIVMPVNKYIKKDTYFTLETEGIKEAYSITGYDIVSTPGVMFISMDPTYIRDQDSETIVPYLKKDEEGEIINEGSFWLNGNYDESYEEEENK